MESRIQKYLILRKQFWSTILRFSEIPFGFIFKDISFENEMLIDFLFAMILKGISFIKLTTPPLPSLTPTQSPTHPNPQLQI